MSNMPTLKKLVVPRRLRVGELAKETGKTVRALHLYEEMGLLKPVERTEGGFRLYGHEAKARIDWITKLQDMGFSLAEIQSFLADWERAEVAPEAMERVRAIFQEKLRQTRDHMARLADLEKELVSSLNYLESCRSCETTYRPSACAACGRHGHQVGEAPVLVAGMQRS